MLCILESSSSEQFAIVNGGEVIQIIHGLISLLIVSISSFSPTVFWMQTLELFGNLQTCGNARLWSTVCQTWRTLQSLMVNIKYTSFQLKEQLTQKWTFAENVLTLSEYSQSHQRCRCSLEQIVDKFSITSLAHQLIFCSEWVLSE